ncbi:hypothetical protein L7F22_050053 [Adiantum nelumboides]|nr:hypothetical protein [Adiantum nelumboides]
MWEEAEAARRKEVEEEMAKKVKAAQETAFGSSNPSPTRSPPQPQEQPKTLGLVAIDNMELIQMDVKTVFLHEDLEENIYMVQPNGFEIKPKKPSRVELVCKLQKAIYGLTQGSRQWYQKFDEYMQSQGYVKSQEDHRLYTQKLRDGLLIILILYVDDMLIAVKSKNEIKNLKESLGKQFAMKDLDDANHFLGMRIKRDKQYRILELSQEKYVHKVLESFGMAKGNTLNTPMQPC